MNEKDLERVFGKVRMGAELKKQREKIRVTPSQVADAVNARLAKDVSEDELPQGLIDQIGTISAQDILDFEAGKKTPHTAVMVKLALIFGVSRMSLERGSGQALGKAANDNDEPEKPRN